MVWLVGLGLLWGLVSLFGPSSPPSSGNVERQTATSRLDVPASGTTKLERKQVLYVTASKLNVRTKPDGGAAVLLSATQGTSVVAVSRSGDWFEVELNNGSTGWMSAQFLSSTKPQSPAKVISEPPKKQAPDRSMLFERSSPRASLPIPAIARAPTTLTGPVGVAGVGARGQRPAAMGRSAIRTTSHRR